MIVRKSVNLRGLIEFAGFHIIWISTYVILVAVLYQVVGWTWVAIPWVPVSLIGTAVAFYLGFKNSQSYDRLWEARKIWGGIVNSSRSWGAMVNASIRSNEISEYEIKEIKTQLIYRHIAWLYTLREQLLVPTQWEHVSLRRHFGTINIKRRDQYGIGLYAEYLSPKQINDYFSDKKLWENTVNNATQIINIQTKTLADLQEHKKVDLFHQIELQKILSDFFVFQGQAERIKKFPFPRQYANSSFVLNIMFIFLLPLGLVAEFSKLGDYGVWIMIPFAIIVCWVYVMMELVGDYSENPFEGLMNDIPMLSMCRTIEIDLLEILGESDLPKPIQPINDILL